MYIIIIIIIIIVIIILHMTNYSCVNTNSYTTLTITASYKEVVIEIKLGTHLVG